METGRAHLLDTVYGLGGYALHQVTIWGLIYYAQKSKLKYVSGLHKVNVMALLANAGFIGLHILQTKVAYDGLAQDVHILTSMGSVVIMLIMILLIENQRRGVVFGAKMPFMKEVARALRKYHGYYFSWALIYTFWYHPIEVTSGHLLGTFYTILILLQGSLFFTRTHTNKWWTLAMELLVVVHGTMVAWMVYQGDNPQGGTPAQFFFGFITIFIITQMHGLGLSKLARWGFALLYIGGIVFYYSGRWAEIAEVPRIAVVEYLGLIIIGLIGWLILRIAALFKSLRGNNSATS
ncbi:hypothetical protein [Oceanicoccus sagamiensis]|nr:hypothetical protein [Oceanicoccus sagamiensis]